MRWRLLFRGATALAVTGSALTGCGSATSAAAGPLSVVAAENPWGNIAAQIGGHRVRVTSLITNPNADPHLYQSDAAGAEAVATARMVIVNGLGYDAFMSKLLASGSARARTVITVARVLQVTGPDANPHLWYAVARMPQVAKAIESALARADPAGATAFSANLAAFDRSLIPLDQAVAAIRTDHAGAPVAYTERVPGYLLAEARLAVETPLAFATAVEDGTDPPPAATAAMDRLIRDHQIRVLLYNTQAVEAVTEHARVLALQAGVPVVGVSETIPGRYRTYQAWQLAQARALQQALSA